MKKIINWTILLFLIASCQVDLSEIIPESAIMEKEKVFYATIEDETNPSTKVYADSNLKLLWSGDERIIIYNRNTTGEEYKFSQGSSNAGTFTLVSSENTSLPGESLNHIYAYYPYDENVVMLSEGVFSIGFPQEQTFKEASFGSDANIMVSVTDNNRLLFKNVGGFLCFKLYGDAVSVSKITLKGNNGEILAGPATLIARLNDTPEVEMASGYGSKKTVTLNCNNPVALNPIKEDYIEFWFVLPPITFSKGFTVTITDSEGGTFEKSTSESITISRNTISRMSPIRVIPKYSDVSPILEEMYVDIGRPAKLYSTPDDWEFLMILFCNDLEGADAIIADNGYNWFSVCGNLSSRNANYRNPEIRHKAPYDMILSSNKIVRSVEVATADEDQLSCLAQARALRAWSYMLLAQAYQFNYQLAIEQPCVPLVSENTADLSNNPRATVREVYNLIIEDLNFAVEILEGTARTSKMHIDGNVAHGLRARAYLDMGQWQKAYDDAVAAIPGYSPATRAEVSKPAFYDISEHNWIWGYDMTYDIAMRYRYATTSSWLRSFSAWGYSAACQVYTCINKLLYDKIPATDIRKQWWVDENLESTLLDGLKWPGFNDVAFANDGGDSKLPYLPYTNVKFGCYSVGTTSNNEDMPLMRAEEMILIQAECKARLGDNAGATSILENFVKTYRDASYSASAGGRTILDEIWFQRRVELWGEGFYTSDMHRLNKPLVRFHDDMGNIAAAFRFNLPADNPWLLMRFPKKVLDVNSALIDNTGGHQPVTDENPDLRDGVTD